MALHKAAICSDIKRLDIQEVAAAFRNNLPVKTTYSDGNIQGYSPFYLQVRSSCHVSLSTNNTAHCCVPHWQHTTKLFCHFWLEAETLKG